MWYTPPVMADQLRDTPIEELEQRRERVLEEIDEYNAERERIRNLLGNIGGKRYSKRDTIINAIFFVTILALFVAEITTHFLPSYISIEIGVLLVSIKIVWMIHSQHKFNHFQFWVLNSIEFRVNEIQRKVTALERTWGSGPQ